MSLEKLLSQDILKLELGGAVLKLLWIGITWRAGSATSSWAHAQSFFQ